MRIQNGRVRKDLPKSTDFVCIFSEEFKYDCPINGILYLKITEL